MSLTTSAELRDFIKMSKYAGMREDLVQAGGGNSSVKLSPERMIIKASGYQLADMTEQDGYAVVNPKNIRDAFMTPESMTDDEGNRVLKEAFIEGKRPSIEAFLHAASGKYTLHTHPVVVNVLTCRKDGMRTLRGLFPDALTVPYATPGIALAREYFNALREETHGDTKAHGVVFLENHGLVVSAESAELVMGTTERIVKTIEEYLGCDMESYRNATDLWQFFPDKIIWKVTDANVLRLYEKMGTWDHAFCPDGVVFLGKKALSLDENARQENVDSFAAAYGEPVVVEFRRQLYLVCDSVKKALETQSVLSFSAQVVELNRDRELRSLTDEEQNFLLHWDAEKYRRNMK